MLTFQSLRGLEQLKILLCFTGSTLPEASFVGGFSMVIAILLKLLVNEFDQILPHGAGRYKDPTKTIDSQQDMHQIFRWFLGHPYPIDKGGLGLSENVGFSQGWNDFAEETLKWTDANWTTGETKTSFKRITSLLRIYGTILGFALVFRTQMSYSRYLQGADGMKNFYSKVIDSCMQLVAFCNVSRLKAHNNPEVLMRLENFKSICAHLYSLLGASAVTELKYAVSDDGETPQICARQFKRKHMAPVVRNLTQHRGFLGRKGALRAVYMKCKMKLQLYLDCRQNYLYYHKSDEDMAKMPWTRAALRRQPFEGAKTMPQFCPVDEEIPGFYKVEVLGPVYHEELLGIADKCRGRAIVTSWIHSLTMAYIHCGWITAQPPIMTRYVLELSNGLAALQSALDICWSPFPFPLAQMLQTLLFPWMIIFPIFCTMYHSHYVWLAFFSFFIPASFWMLNGIAIELENPFGEDLNDLPLLEMHKDFVDSLQTMCEGAGVDDDFDQFMMPLFLSRDQVVKEMKANYHRFADITGGGEALTSVPKATRKTMMLEAQQKGKDASVADAANKKFEESQAAAAPTRKSFAMKKSVVIGAEQVQPIEAVKN